MYWWVAGLGLIAVAGWVTSVVIAVRHARNERRKPAPIDRRAQAERVSVWPGRSADPQPVALLNGSDEPVSATELAAAWLRRPPLRQRLHEHLARMRRSASLARAHEPPRGSADLVPREWAERLVLRHGLLEAGEGICRRAADPHRHRR